MHEPLLQSEEAAKDIITRIILPQYKNNLGRWAVLRKDTDAFIGWCGLKFLPDTGEIDLGYRFYPAAWGRGYATEAAKHVLEYGLNNLHLAEIFGKAHKENMSSIKVLKKIGMQYVGETFENGCAISVYHAVNTK